MESALVLVEDGVLFSDMKYATAITKRVAVAMTRGKTNPFCMDLMALLYNISEINEKGLGSSRFFRGVLFE
jgi:hypothetical protein